MIKKVPNKKTNDQKSFDQKNNWLDHLSKKGHIVERQTHHDYSFWQYDSYLETWSNRIGYATIQHFVIWPNLIYLHILSKSRITKCQKM